MLAKRIIPCLDVKDGRVVKGVHFVDLRDAGDPVECGLRYSDEGADELVFLDITASSDRRNIVAGMVTRVADSINIPFTVGGGLRSVDDIQEILRCGADKVSLNTSAVEDPHIVQKSAERFGSQCIVVAIDARRENGGAKVYTHGGRRAFGQGSSWGWDSEHDRCRETSRFGHLASCSGNCCSTGSGICEAGAKGAGTPYCCRYRRSRRQRAGFRLERGFAHRGHRVGSEAPGSRRTCRDLHGQFA